MVLINIPITLLLMSAGIVALIAWVAYLTIHLKKVMQLIAGILPSMPSLSPTDLEDFELRAEAFRSQDPKKIKEYWARYYERICPICKKKHFCQQTEGEKEEERKTLEEQKRKAEETFDIKLD